MKMLFALCLIAALVGCENEQDAKPSPAEPPKPPQQYQIIAKENPIEVRHQLTLDGIKPKSVTVYYLIREDGHKCEVDVVTWARTKVGDKSTCD